MAKLREIIDDINAGLIDRRKEEERDEEQECEKKLREIVLEISAKLVEEGKTRER